LQQIRTNTGGKDDVTHGGFLASFEQSNVANNELLWLIDG
jgi:hypothetical protein